MKKIVAAALIGTLLLAAPAAFANPARDELIRTEGILRGVSGAVSRGRLVVGHSRRR